MQNVTDKFSSMIHSFANDFSLAEQGKHGIAELDPLIHNGSMRADIYLLNELSYLIRSGKVRILLFEDGASEGGGHEE